MFVKRMFRILRSQRRTNPRLLSKYRNVSLLVVVLSMLPPPDTIIFDIPEGNVEKPTVMVFDPGGRIRLSPVFRIAFLASISALVRFRQTTSAQKHCHCANNAAINPKATLRVLSIIIRLPAERSVQPALEKAISYLSLITSLKRGCSGGCKFNSSMRLMVASDRRIDKRVADFPAR